MQCYIRDDRSIETAERLRTVVIEERSMADHYFTAQPASQAQSHTVSYRARGIDYVVTTSDGVFSARELDRGTRVLLDKVPVNATIAQASSIDTAASAGREQSTDTSPAKSMPPLCADIGCGWGAISLALANEYPCADVVAVDVNERALELTRKNAQALQLSHIQTADTATAMEIAKKRGGIDLIWSNPPIRIGKEALHDLLLTWLAALKPEIGEAYWVVQKNLGADSLTVWLNEQGYPSEKIASQKGFRIIRSRNTVSAWE